MLRGDLVHTGVYKAQGVPKFKSDQMEISH